MSEYSGLFSTACVIIAIKKSSDGSDVEDVTLRIRILCYCRRCEVCYFHNGVFCPCCGMALQMSPTSKRDKEKLRQLKLREEEQDRIIRIIKGIRK